MSSTGSPIIDDMIQPFRRGASRAKQFLDHPLDSLKEMLTPPDPAQIQHDQAIKQMNAETNAHKNDAANESFKPKPKMLPRMK